MSKHQKTINKKKSRFAAIFCATVVLVSSQVYAAPGYDQVSTSTTSKEVGTYGMTPVYGTDVADGTYEVEVESSSSFFHILNAELTVKEGEMTAVLQMSSTSYLYVYPGTGAQAAEADFEDYIPLEKGEAGNTFTIPVKALNQAIDCAAFSKKKERWYDRKLLFDVSSLPGDALTFTLPDYQRIADAVALYDETNGTDTKGELAQKEAEILEFGAGAAENGNGAEQLSAGAAESDGSNASGIAGQASGGLNNTGTASDTEDTSEDGTLPVSMEENDGEYSIEVSMTGGSERASVTSPTWMYVKDGKGYAKLLWSSVYYDYMIVDGKKYLNETTDGSNSTFTIPITVLDGPMEVIADTTAMGDPVEIEYALTFYSDTVGGTGLIPQEAAKKVLVIALAIIILGGILNHFVKKKRRH